MMMMVMVDVDVDVGGAQTCAIGKTVCWLCNDDLSCKPKENHVFDPWTNSDCHCDHPSRWIAMEQRPVD